MYCNSLPRIIEVTGFRNIHIETTNYDILLPSLVSKLYNIYLQRMSGKPFKNVNKKKSTFYLKSKDFLPKN